MSLKRRKFSLDSSVCLEGGNLTKGLRGSGRKSLDEAREQIQELNHTLPVNTFREQSIAEESNEGVDINSNTLVKPKKSFHKLFPEISDGESLTQAFSCALQKDGLFQGKLFVSENHVCFYSSVLLKDTKLVIPLSTVREVRKHHSAMSLTIQTADGEKYLFVSLMNRGMCYKLLQSVCSHAQAESTNSSPHVSSGENEMEFDLMSSNSSMEDSFDGSRQSSVNYDDFPQFSREVHSRVSSESTVTDDGHNRGWIRRMSDRITSFVSINEIRNIKVLFYAYIVLMLLLLMASGYIGMRIIALEEHLTSLGSVAQTLQHTQYKETASGVQ